MKKLFIKATLLGVVAAILCSCQSAPPVDVGDKLILPIDHTFVIPPEGIRFSNGATVGVKQ